MKLKEDNEIIINNFESMFVFSKENDNAYDDCNAIGFYTNDVDTIEEIKNVNRTFIKYDSNYEIECIETNQKKECHIIKFENMPSSIFESIIQEIYNRKTQKNENLIDSLKFIISLFNDHKLKEEFKKTVINDFSNLIFMYCCKKENIDITPFYIESCNSSYFDIKNQKIIVKSKKDQSSNSIEFDYNKSNLFELNKKIEIAIADFLFVEKQSNIIDLLESISITDPLILLKTNHYKSYYTNEIFSKIMDTYTIDLNNVKSYFIDNKIIPNIFIDDQTNLEGLSIKINISKSKNKPLSYIKDLL